MENDQILVDVDIIYAPSYDIEDYIRWSDGDYEFNK